jgi:beta-mannanase
MEEIRITANAKLQEILGQDYNEQMQNVINHAINFLQPDKVKEVN